MKQGNAGGRGRVIAAMVAVMAIAGCGNEKGVGPGPESLLVASPASQGLELSPCDSLQVPDGNRLVTVLSARGDQVYQWNGTSWAFVEPSALLFASASDEWIGTHYAGPTWESATGSRVVGSVIRRCTADPAAIQWLLLGAVRSDGQGLFRGITFIQRLRTAGGLAPAAPGTIPGEIARVPYAAQYAFYRRR